MNLVFILFESCWRSCHILYLSGELSTADALQTEYTVAKAGGIDLVNFVNTMIDARAVKENFDKQEWTPMLTKLQHSDGGYQCFNDLSCKLLKVTCCDVCVCDDQATDAPFSVKIGHLSRLTRLSS